MFDLHWHPSTSYKFALWSDSRQMGKRRRETRGRRWTDVEKREEGETSDGVKEIEGAHDLTSAKAQRSNSLIHGEIYSTSRVLGDHWIQTSAPQRTEPCRNTHERRRR